MHEDEIIVNFYTGDNCGSNENEWKQLKESKRY